MATFGVILIVFSGTILTYLGEPGDIYSLSAGLLGASGVIFFIWGLLAYGGYILLSNRY